MTTPTPPPAVQCPACGKMHRHNLFGHFCTRECLSNTLRGISTFINPDRAERKEANV